ncbi:hypothetical protein BV497_07670, partial [Fulvimonas soli]
MSANDPTRRFSDRVADYVRHRPDYPPALLHWLRRELGASPSWRGPPPGGGTRHAPQEFLDARAPPPPGAPHAPPRGAGVAWPGGDP